MDKRFEFHFTLPAVPEGRQVSAEEAEALLLQRLEDRGALPLARRTRLAGVWIFYQ